MMSVYRGLLVFATLLALSLAQSETTTPTTSTSSTEIPSTTPSIPAPTPAPTPTWTVKSANSTCLLLRGNFSFAVTYTPPTANAAVSQKVDIPPTAIVSGSCGPFINSLVLTWDKNNLTFMFIKKPIYDAGVDTGMGSYSLTTIFGRLTVENPNDDGNGTRPGPSPGSPPSGQSFFIAVKQPEFMSTQLQSSYMCQSFQSVPADNTGSVYLEMKDIQVEAFHAGADANFSESQPCSKDKMSYVMTIVGYAALAALVAAVVGYLAWKKFGRGGYTAV